MLSSITKVAMIVFMAFASIFFFGWVFEVGAGGKSNAEYLDEVVNIYRSFYVQAFPKVLEQAKSGTQTALDQIKAGQLPDLLKPLKGSPELERLHQDMKSRAESAMLSIENANEENLWKKVEAMTQTADVVE